MSKYKKLTINIIVLTFILTGGLSTPASAASSSNRQKSQEQSSREMAILSSFEENDYEAWKKYIGKNSNLALYISEEKFNKFIKIRNLARNAQHDKALAISEEFELELTSELKKVTQQKFPQTSLLPIDPKIEKAKKALDKIKYIKLEALNNLS